MKTYRQRIVDRLLAEKLEGIGAVLIEGAKWCGKTSTAEQHAKSIIYVDNPQEMALNMQLAQINPQQLLEGDTPRLLDEWQFIPELWDAVRFAVDHRDNEGQFILTGSVSPLQDEAAKKIHHSGTGRIARLKMRPMSLWESGDSNGQVSLSDLFNKEKHIAAYNNKDINDIAYLICRGGWPRASLQSRRIALGRAFDYYDTVINADINLPDRVERKPNRVRLFMRSYARNQGTQIALKGICDDMKSNDFETLDDRTVYSYLSALKSIFVVEDCPAWNPNLRSRTTIRTSDTRYFVDPSIAVAALGIGPNDLINDLNTLGPLFETMSIRDLRVYAQAMDGEVYHYRDKDGLECDAVVHLRNGSYGLVEIKLGGEYLIEEGAKSLLKLSSKIDTTRMKPPSFLMVLTATGSYAFQRKDGVSIVPLCCLKD